MFKKRVQTIDEILQRFLRDEGLETKKIQKRLIDSWETVVGDTVAQYTTEKFIKNQTLFVKITNPALRQDLGMMRSQLVKRLNETVSSLIITDIRLY